MPNAMPAGTPQVMPLQPTPQAAPEVAVTQVEEPVPTNSMVAEPEAPKKGHGMLVGLILCLLIAAGGIGFGVWAWMDGNTQKDALNSQIAELKKQNNELREKLSNKPEVEEDVTVDVETESDVNPADYIYVGEWGLKIKVPESLKIVNYSFVEGGVYGDYLSVAGAKDKTDGAVPAYAVLSASTGSIVKSNSDDGFFPYGSLVYTDSKGNKYYYEGANGFPDLPEDELELWKEIRTIIENMLRNSENYSEI